MSSLLRLWLPWRVGTHPPVPLTSPRWTADGDESRSLFRGDQALLPRSLDALLRSGANGELLVVGLADCDGEVLAFDRRPRPEVI